MRTHLDPADRLTLCFLAALAALVLFSVPVIPAWPRLILAYGALAAAIITLAALRRQGGGSTIVDILHAGLPIAAVLVIFTSMGDLIPPLRPHYYDDVLIRVDHLLFGAHPTVWLERWSSEPLTALFQAAYISYYFMPIALGVSLFLRRKEEGFRAAVFAVVLCFYLSYIGYLLVPAEGPRAALAHLQTADLPAGPVTRWARQTLDALEHTKTDAFPSGHTAVALVTLFYAWKFRERMVAGLLAPAAAALIVSTVYLRYHYVVDVIAGFLLAALTVVVAPRLQRLFS